MIQVPPILHLVPHLPYPGLDFTKHRQTRAHVHTRQASLENPLPHDGGAIHRHSHVVGIEQVSRHQSPMSRRISSFARRSCSATATAIRSWSSSGICADSITSRSCQLLMSAGSSEGTQPSTINSCPSCQCSGNSSSGWILPFFRIARIIGPPFFHQAIWSSPREVDGQLRVFGLLVLHRGDVPQRGVPALAVVEHLDVL